MRSWPGQKIVNENYLLTGNNTVGGFKEIITSLLISNILFKKVIGLTLKQQKRHLIKTQGNLKITILRY